MDSDHHHHLTVHAGAMNMDMSLEDKEQLALQLLTSLPRSRLAVVQQHITPLLQFDIIGNLPTELALHVFSNVPYQTLLTCSLVNKRWQRLADDQSLWKALCAARRWVWRQPPAHLPNGLVTSSRPQREWEQSDDEGIGDSDEDDGGDDAALAHGQFQGGTVGSVEEAKAKWTMMHAQLCGWSSNSFPSSSSHHPSNHRTILDRKGKQPVRSVNASSRLRLSSPPAAPSSSSSLDIPPFRRKPDYKLLHQTHIRLRNRFLTPHTSHRLSHLQTKPSSNPNHPAANSTGATGSNGGHTSTIYCLQLYTYRSTNRQVLFTGSRDRTVREWNVDLDSSGVGDTGRGSGGQCCVERVLGGVHTSSVLSIWAEDGYLASAGSDRRVVLWELSAGRVRRVLMDHEDSVLCVRFNNEFLVSCSKDRTVRVYSFPELQPLWLLDEHRAAVNTVSLSGSYIFTGSGDRSIRLWDARSGKLLRTFDNHHLRGIASIDFKPPLVVSGSSDKHIRLFDVTTLQGWSTASSSARDAALYAEHCQSVRDETTAALHGKGGLASLFPPVEPTTIGMGRFGGREECPSCGGQAGGGGGVNGGVSDGTGGGPPRSMEVRAPSFGVGRSPVAAAAAGLAQSHNGLVRSVVLMDDFVVSGSYDFSIKIWERGGGVLLGELSGGHTGRIFCVAADCTKVVSCGEDQTICVWDFAHGIDTSFVEL